MVCGTRCWASPGFNLLENQPVFADTSRALQTGVLSLSGAVIGGGFGLQTWLPYLCIMPTDFQSIVWLQLSVVLVMVPVALAAAVVSRLLSMWLWQSAC